MVSEYQQNSDYTKYQNTTCALSSHYYYIVRDSTVRLGTFRVFLLANEQPNDRSSTDHASNSQFAYTNATLQKI